MEYEVCKGIVVPGLAFAKYKLGKSSLKCQLVAGENTVQRRREDQQRLKARYPEMIVDGEMQAGVAFNQDLLRENYPFSPLVNESPNTLIFPNLAAGNIAYHLLQEVGGAEAVGPILLGLRKPVHVLQLGSSVRQIVNMIAIAVVDAQVKCGRG